MLVLLWGLLNTVLLLFFIITCFRATRLIRENFGLLATIVFVFGLLSFSLGTSNDNSREVNSNHIRTWRFAPEDTVRESATAGIVVELEKTMISKYELGIQYATGTPGQKHIPISANSWTNGFVSGTIWKPLSIIVNPTTDPNKFKYIVDGIVEWKLLGVTVYSQRKKYQGMADV